MSYRFNIHDLASEEERGPAEPPPPPKVCSKCWAEAPCVTWRKYLHPKGGGPLAYFGDKTEEAYECPSHGPFEEKDGVQIFDDVELWVVGPDGERMELK